MPLTPFQHTLLAILASDQKRKGYLAGGAALHFQPNSARFSDDLDFFHDSIDHVAMMYAADREVLAAAGISVTPEVSQPGFIRGIVTGVSDVTRVDWAHDSSWRFMPLVEAPLGGLLMHPVDLAINKVLALAGRDEPRDFVDILFTHEHILPLGAHIWAAVGKDPGFTPLSLLELLKRRGRYQPTGFTRLALVKPFDLLAAKTTWLAALRDAEEFIRARPPEEAGCLYWSEGDKQFVMPRPDDMTSVPHYGTPGGVLPRILEE